MTTENPAGSNTRSEREAPWGIRHECSSVHLLEDDFRLRYSDLESCPGVTNKVRRDVDSETGYAIRLRQTYEELSLTTGDIDHRSA